MPTKYQSTNIDTTPRGAAVDDNEFLTTREVCELLRISYPTLNRWRYKGHGPAHVALTAKKIMYRAGAVRAWIAAQEAASNTLAA